MMTTMTLLSYRDRPEIGAQYLRVNRIKDYEAGKDPHGRPCVWEKTSESQDGAWCHCCESDEEAIALAEECREVAYQIRQIARMESEENERAEQVSESVIIEASEASAGHSKARS